jgi:glutamyl-tRNA synthetase
MSRILSLNEHYIKHTDEEKLFELLKIYSQKYKKSISLSKENSLIKSMNFLKNKAKTLGDIYQNSQYILQDVVKISPEDSKLLDNSAKNIIKDFLKEFEKMSTITKENLEKTVNGLIDKHKTNFKGVGQPLRIVLTGSRFGPGIYNIILSLNKDVVIRRLKN